MGHGILKERLLNELTPGEVKVHFQCGFDGIKLHMKGRKEAIVETPKTRKPVKEIEKKVYFRRRPLSKVVLSPTDVLQEQQQDDEIIFDSSEFDDREEGESSQFQLESIDNCPSDSRNGAKKFRGIDPVRVGYDSYHMPQEQMSSFRKSLGDSTLPRLSFDFSTIDQMISEGSSVDPQSVLFAIRGMMTIAEVQNEKLIPKKPMDHTKQVTATLDPRSFLDHQVIEVETLDGKELINVNETLSFVSPQSGTLKSVLQSVANLWVNAIIPKSERQRYSTSDKPKGNTISLPTRFLNAPIQLIFDSVQLNVPKDSAVKMDISLFFKMHIGNLFHHARNIAKNGPRKRHHQD
ncbi:hypothetical protein GCK72_004234 [Caenorhabditis remanei]|uniref:Uncharacterized protein n=1 Tax=Caenorhabditis remanei TaxID=31234 RepID=A0A6A5HAW1_CAERE|nr:hypothetical protein GCK72_004234 [Caenorhabditis remanei]KAF1764287.1 hypothetical protein GCK72_004234 [Caenorhabditis remanei]